MSEMEKEFCEFIAKSYKHLGDTDQERFQNAMDRGMGVAFSEGWHRAKKCEKTTQSKKNNENNTIFMDRLSIL